MRVLHAIILIVFLLILATMAAQIIKNGQAQNRSIQTEAQRAAQYYIDSVLSRTQVDVAHVDSTLVERHEMLLLRVDTVNGRRLLRFTHSVTCELCMWRGMSPMPEDEKKLLRSNETR